MKRRVASLPPVSTAVFEQKIIESRQETPITSSTKGSNCEVCNKAYTTENAYRSHINSRKHKENTLRAASKPMFPPKDSKTLVDPCILLTCEPKVRPIQSAPAGSEDEINQTIDEKIASTQSRIVSTQCLFCPEESLTLADNLTHMSTTHSFFIPDAEYLIDISGLIMYLGEKIAVGNVCIFCNGKGREFKTLFAVRKHMLDKSHCKIAYSSENEKLEVSDFYDFSTSYPDIGREKKRINQSKEEGEDEADGWEDMTDDGSDSVDEIVDEVVSDKEKSEDESNLDSESLPDSGITYGDSHLELVLPSGSRIGHRSMRRYYAQSLPRGSKPADPNSGAALVRRLLADKNSALVPSGGGFGAFGRGTQVVKARNKGEAREAGRHIREFRDQKRREDFKTKVGFISNHQKHLRDPLLQ